MLLLLLHNFSSLEPPMSVSHTKTNPVVLLCIVCNSPRVVSAECDGNVRLVDLCGPIRGTMGGRS